VCVCGYLACACIGKSLTLLLPPAPVLWSWEAVKLFVQVPVELATNESALPSCRHWNWRSAPGATLRIGMSCEPCKSHTSFFEHAQRQTCGVWKGDTCGEGSSVSQHSVLSLFSQKIRMKSNTLQHDQFSKMFRSAKLITNLFQYVRNRISLTTWVVLLCLCVYVYFCVFPYVPGFTGSIEEWTSHTFPVVLSLKSERLRPRPNRMHNRFPFRPSVTAPKQNTKTKPRNNFEFRTISRGARSGTCTKPRWPRLSRKRDANCVRADILDVLHAYNLKRILVWFFICPLVGLRIHAGRWAKRFSTDVRNRKTPAKRRSLLLGLVVKASGGAIFAKACAFTPFRRHALFDRYTRTLNLHPFCFRWN
jgi:hypothetical protein